MHREEHNEVGYVDANTWPDARAERRDLLTLAAALALIPVMVYGIAGQSIAALYAVVLVEPIIVTLLVMRYVLRREQQDAQGDR